ncbi:hypothetical protein [Chitinophaga sp. 212800010-3]|uniref:hypothetical protein n=1 Tax=unclassified Chitinophaga TaxID=2619133 RepID=UPI002E12D54A
MLNLSDKSASSCPDKQAIFHAVRTWEEARAANAFPDWVKRELKNTSLYFHLETINANAWNLYKTDRQGNRLLIAHYLNSQLNRLIE